MSWSSVVGGGRTALTPKRFMSCRASMPATSVPSSGASSTRRLLSSAALRSALAPVVSWLSGVPGTSRSLAAAVPRARSRSVPLRSAPELEPKGATPVAVPRKGSSSRRRLRVPLRDSSALRTALRTDHFGRSARAAAVSWTSTR